MYKKNDVQTHVNFKREYIMAWFICQRLRTTFFFGNLMLFSDTCTVQATLPVY